MTHLAGAKLLLNSNAHNTEESLTPTSIQAIAQGAGLNDLEIKQVLEVNPRLLLRKLGPR